MRDLCGRVRSQQVDRSHLQRELEEITALQERRQALLSKLAAVEESIADHDEKVAEIVKAGEVLGYTPKQWRELLGGLEERVSAVCSRHSLRSGLPRRPATGKQIKGMK